MHVLHAYPDKSRDGRPTISVAHEALFRVWDTLYGWLLQDRKALSLGSQIEDAAAEWDAAQRAESRQWPEERILDAVSEISRSGVSLDDVRQPRIVRAFLGPTDPAELSGLATLGEDQDEPAGRGRYGGAWRLPLVHAARASVGVRLALVGDHRKGVGLRAGGLPDIDWVPIGGGEVTIEIHADPDDPSSAVVKRPTRSVNRFWMARYPVTIAQFRAFLGDCYREDGLHLPPGFKIDRAANYQPPTHRTRHDNHPADAVSWYDSMAFSHWLSVRLDFEVRLPTEFEWQHAAIGGDLARTYPWGRDWDPKQESWRANTSESGLARSTAVGMYPDGATRAGILDMAGTVWEWCLDPFETAETAQGSWLSRMLSKRSADEDRRVLRGGSWFDTQPFACAAFRVRNNPFNRDSYVTGFRVVCSSPPPRIDL